MSHNSQTVIQGLKGLATFLNKERLKLQRDTIVLISSEPTSTIERPAVEDAVRQIQFMLQQRFAFRVAPVQVKSAIPDSSVKLNEVAKRVGAKTIVAVGSGNAMDVAKWATIPQHNNNKRIIYVPATYGASMVASTPMSLKINAQGEIDVVAVPVEKNQTQAGLTAENVHHVLLEEAHFDTETKNIALAAALAICYDAGLPIPNALPSTHHEVYEFMAKAGRNLSYGLDAHRKPRSKPLAIATALQATLFPNYTLLEIMASLLPAYDPPRHMVPPDVPQFLTTESWETVVASLRENAATWNCWDEPEEDLRELLSKKHMI